MALTVTRLPTRREQLLALVLLRVCQASLAYVLLFMGIRWADIALPDAYWEDIVTSMPVGVIFLCLSLQTVFVIPLWFPPSLTRWLPEAKRTAGKYAYLPLLIATGAVLLLLINCFMNMPTTSSDGDIL